MAVEVDEHELATLRRAAALLGQLNNSPKSRTHLERAVKEHYPEVQTEEELVGRFAQPHVDGLKKQIENLAKTVNDRFTAEDERRQKQAQEDADNALRAQFQNLKKQGFTEEGIAKVVDLMVNKNIPDVDAAVALFEKQNPKPVETTSAWEPQTWKIADEEGAGPKASDWFKDPEGTSDRVIADTLRDIRSNAV